jgi:hypothetical protein
MDTPNPLQFFIDLADEKPIELSEDEPKVGLDHTINSDKDSPDEKPIESSETLQYHDKYGDLLAGLDEEPVKLTDKPLFQPGGADDLYDSYSDSTGYWNNSYFTVNLPSKLSREKTNAIQAVDTVLAGMSDIGTAFSKLTELVTSIDTAIGKLSTYEDVKQYPAILNTYNEIKGELSNRKKRLIQPPQADHHKKQAPAKIQWVGQVNVLGTLFYHLLKGQDGGAPYISASVEQVKRMLTDNFIDHEGFDLSKATLDTIFTPSRSEKRANVGDRIELPNKKAKK